VFAENPQAAHKPDVLPQPASPLCPAQYACTSPQHAALALLLLASKQLLFPQGVSFPLNVHTPATFSWQPK